jgi:RHS repeat-associated protein
MGNSGWRTKSERIVKNDQEESELKHLSVKTDENEQVIIVKFFNIPIDFPFDTSDNDFKIRYNDSMFSESAAYDVLPGHGGHGASSGNFYSSSAATLNHSTPGISRASELFNTYYIYIFDGKLLAEYDHNGNCVKDYIYADNRLIAEYKPQTGEYFYYMTDQINSTRIITNDSGNVVFSEAYGPYGDVQKNWVNTYDPKLKFSGKEREGYSELDYFGARYYDHKSYRFNSVDPIINREEALVNPQLWNLYAYCRNNPITYLDPDGKIESPYFTGRWRQYLYKKWVDEGGSEYADQKQAELHASDFKGGIIAGTIILSIITRSIPVNPNTEEDKDDYPENPDDLELQDGWHETEAKDKTGGRHRIWKGPNDEVDKEGRKGSKKERGSHYHDSRIPGEHIKPGTKKKDLEKKHGG